MLFLAFFSLNASAGPPASGFLSEQLRLQVHAALTWFNHTKVKFIPRPSPIPTDTAPPITSVPTTEIPVVKAEASVMLCSGEVPN